MAFLEYTEVTIYVVPPIFRVKVGPLRPLSSIFCHPLYLGFQRCGPAGPLLHGGYSTRPLSVLKRFHRYFYGLVSFSFAPICAASSSSAMKYVRASAMLFTVLIFT